MRLGRSLALPCALAAAAVISTPAAGQVEQLSKLFSGDDSMQLTDDRLEHFHVTEMPLATALRMLSVQSKRNIVASPNVTGKVTANFFDVTLENALRAILAANDCDYIERDGFIYVHTNAEMATLNAQRFPLTAKVFTLNYVQSAEAVTAVTPLLSPQGKITRSTEAEIGLEVNEKASGGDKPAGNEFLVVYDYPQNLQTVEAVLQQIDVRPRQVLIEATILRARLTDNNALGVDFSMVGGVDLELLNSRSLGVQNLTLGEMPQDRFQQFNANMTTNFTGDVPDGGLTLGIIKDHVAVFLRALEQITDTSVIANPKVLALNKQIGNIIVGRRDGYITTTVTETQAVQKVEFLETGTQLTFRPFVGTDGYVRVELHPEDSVGGLTAAQLPFEQTTEVMTNVIVRDGNTILIGGLFREVTSETRGQLPVLGDLPYLGDLFRSRADDLDREEVIILLTVHVIKDDALYAEKSLEAFDGLEKARVGLRQGMMWHGRERLAQSFYRRALESFDAGDIDKASWNVQMALHNYPRFLAAIELKDKIEQSRSWEEDGTIGREFIFNLIRKEEGVDERLFGRPPRATLRQAAPSNESAE